MISPSVATYTCDGGNPPTDGDATRTCQEDGSWSGVAPTSCCAGIILHDGTCSQLEHDDFPVEFTHLNGDGCTAPTSVSGCAPTSLTASSPRLHYLTSVLASLIRLRMLTPRQTLRRYAGSPLADVVTLDQFGRQHWIVPSSGTYRFEAYGAGGRHGGAKMAGDFELTCGTPICFSLHLSNHFSCL
eukprot:COSAG06_NODE_4303_length_4382_cov_1.437310_7_plen_186_part_00